MSFLFFTRCLALNVSQGITLDDLKVELAQINTTLRKSGTSYPHETTPSQLISQALEVEEQQ